jgi:transposase-like protein
MPMQRQGLPFDRLRWTEEDARNALKALHESGKSVSVFAAEHGIDPQRLYSWRRRLGGAERTTFQELMIPPLARQSVTDAESSPFEIVLASGVVIRVPPFFDAAALQRLLEVVRPADAC